LTFRGCVQNIQHRTENTPPARTRGLPKKAARAPDICLCNEVVKSRHIEKVSRGHTLCNRRYGSGSILNSTITAHTNINITYPHQCMFADQIAIARGIGPKDGLRQVSRQRRIHRHQCGFRSNRGTGHDTEHADDNHGCGVRRGDPPGVVDAVDGPGRPSRRDRPSTGPSIPISSTRAWSTMVYHH
jgi:hypothetical protein